MDAKQVFEAVYLRLGTNVHVSVHINESVQILVTDPVFRSAIHKIDIAKQRLAFEKTSQRTDIETATLNLIVECMQECQSIYQPRSISLLHPDDDTKVLFSTKRSG